MTEAVEVASECKKGGQCDLHGSAPACRRVQPSHGMGRLKRCMGQVPSGLLPALEVDGQLWTESADIMSLLEVGPACVPPAKLCQHSPCEHLSRSAWGGCLCQLVSQCSDTGQQASYVLCTRAPWHAMHALAPLLRVHVAALAAEPDTFSFCIRRLSARRTSCGSSCCDRKASRAAFHGA